MSTTNTASGIWTLETQDSDGAWSIVRTFVRRDQADAWFGNWLKAYGARCRLRAVKP